MNVANEHWFVTPKPWHPPTHGGPMYGAIDTYELAADWLRECDEVADWGGGYGYFARLIPPTVKYLLVDGTVHKDHQVLADLMTYREPSAGILLRHVLEHVVDWRLVLENALHAFQKRMVVVTFSPDAERTNVSRIKSGWPVRSFAPDELRRVMGTYLVADGPVATTHPERVYFLERR